MVYELMYCECDSLGCGIGYGYLHRIPTRSIESTSPKAFPPSGSPSPVKVPLPGTGFNEVVVAYCCASAECNGLSLLSLCQQFDIHYGP